MRKIILISLTLLSLISYAQKLRNETMKIQYLNYPNFKLPSDFKTVQLHVLLKSTNKLITPKMLGELSDKYFVFDSLKPVKYEGDIIVDFIIGDEIPRTDIARLPGEENVMYYSYSNSFIAKDKSGKKIAEYPVYDINGKDTYKVTTAPNYDIKTFQNNLGNQFLILTNLVRDLYDYSYPQKSVNFCRVKGDNSEKLDDINNKVEQYFTRNKKVKPPYTKELDSLKFAFDYYESGIKTLDANKKEDKPFVYAYTANLIVLYTVVEDFAKATDLLAKLRSLDFKDIKSNGYEMLINERKKNKETYDKNLSIYLDNSTGKN